MCVSGGGMTYYLMRIMGKRGLKATVVAIAQSSVASRQHGGCVRAAGGGRIQFFKERNSTYPF